MKFISIDVAPWASSHPKTGAMEGAFIELVSELEQRTGYSIHITLTPFARVDRELESGDHDCTILIPRDTAIVEHGEVVTGHDIGVVSRRDSPLSDYEDLENRRISLLRSSSISERFDQDPNIQREYDTDYLIALRKLSRRRVDGVAGAIPTLIHLAEQNGLGEMLGSPLTLSQVPLVFQCSRNSPNIDVMPEFNRAIQEIRDKGILESITDKYHF